MPGIYLSPAVHESEPYIIGGSDEYYSNQIVDAMIPELTSKSIRFARSNPGDTVSQVITKSNSGNFDLHLLIRSGTSPEGMRGILKGPDVYYYSGSRKGQHVAEIIAGSLKKIYPNPELVTSIPTTVLAELRNTGAPAVMVQIAYQDNYQDAAWVRDHTKEIAEKLVQSVAKYLDTARTE